MNRSSAKLKRYIQDLIRKTKKPSLMELMNSVQLCLNESTSSVLSGIRSFKLIEKYYIALNKLIGHYALEKKLSRTPMRLKQLKKETAKKFVDILKGLSDRICNCLSVIPPGLQEDDFVAWKEKTEKGGCKILTEFVSNAKQVNLLRKNLTNIKTMVENITDERILKMLV